MNETGSKTPEAPEERTLHNQAVGGGVKHDETVNPNSDERSTFSEEGTSRQDFKFRG